MVGKQRRRFAKAIITIFLLGISAMVLILVFVLALFFLKVPVAKAEAVHGNKPARGYFWYECGGGLVKNADGICVKREEPPQEITEEKSPEPTVAQKEPEKDPEEFEFPVRAEAPPVLRTFLLEPTEENAKKYLAWQYQYFAHLKKIGYNLRNAYLRFGGELYPVNGYPESPLASVYYHQVKDDLFKAAIGSVRDKIGLIYFYRNDCPGCQHQKEIVAILMKKYGLSVRGVPVDGVPDSTLPYPSVVDPKRIEGLIAEHGITQIPSILAVLDKEGTPRISGLSAGFTALDMIEQQLVRFLVQEGVIREADMNPVFVKK